MSDIPLERIPGFDDDDSYIQVTADFWTKRIKEFAICDTEVINAPPYSAAVTEARVGLGTHIIRVGDCIQLKKKPGFEDAEFLRVDEIYRNPVGAYSFRGPKFARSKYFPIPSPQLNEVTMLVRGTHFRDNLAVTNNQWVVCQSEVDKVRNLAVTNAAYPVHNPARGRILKAIHSTSSVTDPTFPLVVKNKLRENGPLVCRTIFTVLATERTTNSKNMNNKEAVLHCIDYHEADFDYRSDSTNGIDLDKVNMERLQTYVSCFTGCGGDACGARYAGLNVVGAFDSNQRAIETFEANHPGVNVACCCQSDVIKGLTSLSSLTSKYIDILHLSCPCKFFARCKTRPGKNDDANHAVSFCVAHHLQYFKPLVVTLEQTSGILVEKKHQGSLFRIISDILSQGYNLRLKLMDMREGGLPTIRDRLIMIGARKEIPLPPFPSMPYGPEGSGKRAFRTPKDVLRPRADDLDFENVNNITVRKSRANYPTWHPTVCGSLGTMTCKGFEKKKQLLGHWSGDRDFTVPEYGQLQGFSPYYQFKGSFSEIKEQIGNAIPPCVWMHVMTGIRQWLEDWKTGKLLDTDLANSL